MQTRRKTITALLPDDELDQVLGVFLETLRPRYPRFRLVNREKNQLELRHGIGLRSYGECITIIAELEMIHIRSRSVFPFQLVDWGKNRWNVQIMSEIIEDLIAEKCH